MTCIMDEVLQALQQEQAFRSQRKKRKEQTYTKDGSKNLRKFPQTPKFPKLHKTKTQLNFTHHKL